MTRSLRETRVHSVHLVNIEQRQAAADPQTKPHDLGCESACFRQLSSTTTIAIYYYAALLPRRGPHIASHSVCPSVCLSVRPVIVAIGNVFSSTASVTDVLFGTH